MKTRLVVAVIAVSFFSLGSAWGDARTPTVRDLVRTVRVSDPHFSPDGKMLVSCYTCHRGEAQPKNAPEPKAGE